MKDVKIDEAIRQDAELLEDVERVTQLLEAEMGPSSAEITVEWSYHDIGRERLLKIEISDQEENASVVCSRRTISHIARTERPITLIRLWGDLLQARSRRQVEKLKQIVQALVRE